MEVCFLASGERAAVLDAAEFEGKSAKAVKQALAAKIGATRFRQRLFLDGEAAEISDDEVFASAPVKLQLVVLEFCPPDVAEDMQMMSAARRNDADALETLLKCPRSPNTSWGMIPLVEAAEHGHVEPMRLLLEACAEIDPQSKQPAFATLHVAARNGHVGAVRFLPETDMTPLHKAARNGHLEAVRFLVQNSAQKDLTDAIGRTPLGLAVLNGRVDIARFLVEEGANKDELFNKLNGTTALNIKAEGGDLNMVRFLLDTGCDKDAADGFGATPLHRAAQRGHLDIVCFLVESGACRHSTDKDGKTALDLASDSGHAEVVRFLSEFEAESPSRKVQRVDSDRLGQRLKLAAWSAKGR